MRTLKSPVQVLGAGAAFLAAAGLSVVAAQPASAAAPGHKVGTITVNAASSTNTSSVSPLTRTARLAGKAKFGADATYQEALHAYWTPARMAAATPVEDDEAFQSSVAKYGAKQEALRKAGKKPVTNDGPPRKIDGVVSKVLPGGVEAAYNPNLPYYATTAYTQGKVFFTQAGGGNFVCSATIINSEGKDSVWTAGHCVHGGKGGSWHYNWTFVPAYDDDLANPRPYGTWSAYQLHSRTAWTNNSDFSQDMGVATMNPNASGTHIVDYFGGHGITLNQGKSGVYEYAFGYPAEYPFDGGNLYRCSGSTSPEWDAGSSWSQTVKIPCDMTRGSSGGGWLNGYDGNWGWLNGLNSRIDRISGPTIMLSPYFDEDAWDLYNYTRNN